jgi:hypothetical protein
MSHARDAFYIPYYTHLIFDSCFLCSILVQRVMFFVFHLDPASITRQRMSNTTLTRLGRMNNNMSAQIMPLVPGTYEPSFTAVSHFSVNVELLW